MQVKCCLKRMICNLPKMYRVSNARISRETCKVYKNPFVLLQFHCQSLPEEDKEVAVNANVVVYKGQANKAEMLAALPCICEDWSVIILLETLLQYYPGRWWSTAGPPSSGSCGPRPPSWRSSPPAWRTGQCTAPVVKGKGNFYKIVQFGKWLSKEKL